MLKLIWLLLIGASLSTALAPIAEPAQQLLIPQYSDNKRAKAVLDFHKLLVETESVSGHEYAVGVLLTNFLESHNFTVETQTLPFLPGNPHSNPRRNIFAYRGAKRETRTLLTSHIDTVPPFYGYRRSHGRISGRGSVDAKACVATQIAALMELLEDAEVADDDVALLYVVGEEVGGDGMTEANNLGLAWESVIFGEPTESKLAAGHKGAFSLHITAHGQAGHSGYPWLGENANHMLLPALLALRKVELPSSKKYGNTTMNIGFLEGGVAANVIAEKSIAKIQYRLAAGDPVEIQQQLKQVVLAIDDRLEVEFTTGYGPISCETDIEGLDTIDAVNYGTDIPWLHGNHKRYLYGPGSILVAHSDHENLTTKDLFQAVSDYKRIVTGALKAH